MSTKTQTEVPMTTNTVTEVPAGVALAGVSKVYGRGTTAVQALDKVSLTMAPGEFTCLIGASGCGKSTLLNLVAGLDKPTGGSITVNGRIAMMFQEPGLFPWLSAAGNIELALRARGVARAERKRRALELLDTVHLGGFGPKQPHELSGGMRQRVALARALAQEADVLFVTHNVREAARLGDRVVLLSSRPGRVIEEYPVPIPRPRRIDSQPVSELAGAITDRLREEVSRHG
jgi:NitT/TauT family transport system ATP-binding protein